MMPPRQENRPVNTHRYALLLALAALIAWSQQALGLATEHFGNAPVPAGFFNSSADLLPVLNDKSRVYWYEVNGDAFFYYKGNTEAVNAMLEKFAAVGKGREVVLHAGPMKLNNLGRTKHIDANWYVHVPGGGGIRLSDYADGGLVTDTGPAIHIYLPSARATSSAPAAKITAWIDDLDSDMAKVRGNASRELEKQGQAIEVTLRKTLETTGSAEVKKRIRALLGKLSAINLDLLVFPKDLTVIGPDELVARCTKGLKSKEYVIRGIAASELAELEPDLKKAVEGLLKVLKDDEHEYVRRSVIGSLQREGWAARSALPELKKLAHDPDVNIKNAVARAVGVIEKAKEETGGEERTKLVTAVRKDIAAFLKVRAAKSAP